MLKKILTIISVLLVAVNVCAYAEQTDGDYERLVHLGLIDGSYEKYEKMKTVSQKEFLKALVKTVTDEKVDDDRVSEYAKAKGIISTINTIELNSAITYERALNLSLNVLGYAKVIEMKENKTVAILNLAGTTKLNSGITLKPNDNIDGKSFMRLLTNLIKADVLTVSKFTMSGPEYKQSNKGVLSEYRNIKKVKGRVTGVCDTSLLSESGCGKDRIAIDDFAYKIGYDYSPEILGQIVYAYIKQVNDAWTVCHIEIANSNVKRTEIKDKDILVVESASSTVTKITYKEDGTTNYLTLNPALTVIYNGQNYTTGYTAADLKPKSGSIVCIDFENDNIYDIVYVYSYDTVVVKSVSQAYRTILNLYTTPTGISEIDLDDKTILDVRIYSEGEEASFSSILPNNILSIAQSKASKRIVTIYISKETVSGEFSSIDFSEKTAIINETEYRLNAEYCDAASPYSPSDTISAGSLYTCYLDVFGNIAFANRDPKDGFEYAFLLNHRWISREDTGRLRLLNTDGEWEDVYLAEKVKLDAYHRQDARTVYDNYFTGIHHQLVMIKRDDEGKIKTIKTAQYSTTYEPNKFTYSGASATLPFTRKFWKEDESLNCRHYVKYDAVVFLKPKTADPDKEDNYAVRGTDYFGGDKEYEYFAYNVDEFGFPDAFLISAKGAVTGGKDATIYVNKVKDMLNGDGEHVKAVVGNVAGLENMTVQVSPDFTGTINPGDIIEVVLKDAVITKWNKDPVGDDDDDNPTDPGKWQTNLAQKHGNILWATQYLLEDATSYGRIKVAAPDTSSKIHKNYQFFIGDIKAVNLEKRILLLDCGTDGIVPVHIREDANINIYNNDKEQYELKKFTDIPTNRYAIIRMNGNNVKSVGIYK